MLPPSYKTLIEQLSLSVVTRELVIDFSVFTKIQYNICVDYINYVEFLASTVQNIV